MLKVSGNIDILQGAEISAVSVYPNITASYAVPTYGNTLWLSDTKNTILPIKNDYLYYGDMPFTKGSDYFFGFKSSDASSAENDYEITSQLHNQFTIESSSNNFNTLNIAFDYKNGIYPTRLIINETSNEPISVTNDSALLKLSGLTPRQVGDSYYHTIHFVAMNKPNVPLIITGIFSKLSVDIDSRRLDELTLEHQSVGDNERPSFGIISNSGDISLIDYDMTFKSLAQLGLLNEDCPITMTATDTLTGKSATIGKYLTNSWQYNTNNNTVSVSLKDDLLTWQELAFDGFVGQIQHFDEQARKYYYSDSGNYADIYQKITENFPNVIITDFLDVSFIELLESLIDGEIQICQMSRSPLWGAMQKLCEVSGVHIFKTYDNEIGFSYGY